MDKIIIKGARENNLKNINIEIPKNKLVVMTGVSGSGKSSLAFDTIYAEGQRRYVESLSAYARQFLDNSGKPDVDVIEGLSPSISIDQKTTNKNPRSTVGTITEIYDYLRLLFARVGVPYCPNHHIPITSQSIEEMTNKILELEENTKIMVMSPVVRGEKGTQKDLFEKLRKEGYIRVKVDNEIKDLSEEIELEKNKKHNIYVIVDRLVIKEGIRSRLYSSLETATKLGHGKVIIDVIGGEEILLSDDYACPYCDYSLEELEPRIFSFNAPYGSCEDCKGLGIKYKIDVDLVIPDRNKSILEGAINPINIDEESNITYTELTTVAKYYNISSNEILSKKRNMEIVTPRHVAMYLCRSLTDTALAEIGNIMGGRDHTTVIHGCEKIEKELSIRFINHGNTIPQEKLARIFEQFYRLDTSRSSGSGGAGLGLAIAKEIVELHHGTITAKSEDEIVEFEVVLPAG